MIVKTCTIHGDLTAKNIISGKYKNRPYMKCRHCVTISRNKYYADKYNDPAWIARKHEADRKYWATKKDKITKKRQRPENLAKRREQYQRRIDIQCIRAKLQHINNILKESTKL